MPDDARLGRIKKTHRKRKRKRRRAEGRGLGQAEKLLGFSTAVVIIASIVV